jgi:5-oxoprolinase (ATP-hydrolysing)/N-methylhydantoinase A
MTGPTVAANRTFDAAELEILWSRLIGIADECWRTIARTAFSLLVAESYDFGCELFDRDGRSVAHSPRSMPLFNLALPLTVQSVLRRFPVDDLVEGDVLITNDPWLGAGHLPDFAVVTPVFAHGKVVAFVGSIVNVTDIGGARHINTREVYEEGLQIPPLKLYSAGVRNDDLFAIIAQNVRQSEMVLGDVAAQHAANEVARERLVRFLDEYQLPDLVDLAKVIEDLSETAMRNALSAIPDGTYRSSIEFDSTGRVLTFPVAVEIDGDRVRVDWSGAPPQVPGPGVNCTLNYTRSHSAYALKCILTPGTPSNAGCYRTIEVSAPEGSILNCTYPAPVQQRNLTGWFCGPAIHSALAGAVPQHVQAFTGIPLWLRVFGTDESGASFDDYFCCSGGQGASSQRDGKDAILFPTSAANTSVELFEVRVPLLVERKELVSGSGGQGYRRGGKGSAVTLRMLDDEGSATISFQSAGMLVEPCGLLGGQPGRKSRAVFEVGGREIELGAVETSAELHGHGERFTLQASGGAGFGTPTDGGGEPQPADRHRTDAPVEAQL